MLRKHLNFLFVPNFWSAEFAKFPVQKITLFAKNAAALFPQILNSFLPSLTHSFLLFLYFLLPLFSFFSLFFFLHNLEPSIQICSNMRSRPSVFLLTSKRMPLLYYFMSCSIYLCRVKEFPLFLYIAQSFCYQKFVLN